MVKDVKKRNYTLDLLRILSMIMIITLHYINHGYKINEVGSAGNNTLILWIIYAFCFGAVNIYVLISGYFLCESEFKWKKVLKLWIEVMFYSLGIFFILYLTGNYSINSLGEFNKVFLPVLSKSYWFVSIYLTLYIISPFLNKLIKNLSKKEYLKLLGILSLLLICNNFVLGTNLIDNTYGSGIVWFIYLYLVAAYIRKHDIPQIKNIYYLLLFCGFTLITYLSRYVIIHYLKNVPFPSNVARLPYSYNSIFVFVASVALFMFFKNMKIKEILPKLISKISIATFGVYLIHDNFIVRGLIYEKVLKIPYYATQSLPIKATAMFVSIIVVFIACTLIDLIRQAVFKKLDL